MREIAQRRRKERARAKVTQQVDFGFSRFKIFTDLLALSLRWNFEMSRDLASIDIKTILMYNSNNLLPLLLSSLKLFPGNDLNIPVSEITDKVFLYSHAEDIHSSKIA